jgi:hypothetical protein
LTSEPTFYGSGSEDVLAALQELHPPRKKTDHSAYTDYIDDYLRTRITPIIITPQDAYNLIRKSPKLIAAGAYGFRNEHKRSLAGGVRNQDEVHLVLLYVNTCYTSLMSARAGLKY